MLKFSISTVSFQKCLKFFFFFCVCGLKLCLWHNIQDLKTRYELHVSFHIIHGWDIFVRANLDVMCMSKSVLFFINFSFHLCTELKTMRSYKSFSIITILAKGMKVILHWGTNYSVIKFSFSN